MTVDEFGRRNGRERDMVQIDSLEKYFGEDKERVHVLKGVSLNIPEGSLYTFLGPSGCGKTTTLRCVAGLGETRWWQD